MKAAVVVNDNKNTGMVAVSFYDRKTEYFLSNSCKKNKLIKNTIKLFHMGNGGELEVRFFRVNINADYNLHMVNVYIYDQLTIVYRTFHRI